MTVCSTFLHYCPRPCRTLRLERASSAALRIVSSTACSLSDRNTGSVRCGVPAVPARGSNAIGTRDCAVYLRQLIGSAILCTDAGPLQGARTVCPGKQLRHVISIASLARAFMWSNDSASHTSLLVPVRVAALSTRSNCTGCQHSTHSHLPQQIHTPSLVWAREVTVQPSSPRCCSGWSQRDCAISCRATLPLERPAWRLWPDRLGVSAVAHGPNIVPV